MAVKLETMKDSEIQYVLVRHSAVGYSRRAANTLHRVEMGGGGWGRKEIDPLVMKKKKKKL